jgi:integrase
MLKATLNVKENIDIGAFLKVIAFLKRNAVGYEAKKSKVLTREEVNTFLKETDDNVYLLMKVALLFGICGACRREELHSLHVGDIVEQGSSLFITLSDTKTHSKRVFSVTADGEAVNALELYRKYAVLRPLNVQHDYFFFAYRNQKCTVQRVGIHSFNYLKLPNPEMYTGHCFRRTSATFIADTGADFVTLKRLGGWRSSSVAESYIKDSFEKKRSVKINSGRKSCWFINELVTFFL